MTTDRTGKTLSIGTTVTMAEIASDSEDDIGEVVKIDGDKVHVAWAEAGCTYIEDARDLVISDRL